MDEENIVAVVYDDTSDTYIYIQRDGTLAIHINTAHVLDTQGWVTLPTRAATCIASIYTSSWLEQGEQKARVN